MVVNRILQVEDGNGVHEDEIPVVEDGNGVHEDEIPVVEDENIVVIDGVHEDVDDDFETPYWPRNLRTLESWIEHFSFCFWNFHNKLIEKFKELGYVLGILTSNLHGSQT